jgi:outer membrane protein OmpA-like peptidoglycan-associated protein
MPNSRHLHHANEDLDADVAQCRDGAAFDPQTLSTLSASSMVGLQRLSGNQAVGRYLQRCTEGEVNGHTAVQRQPMTVVQRQDHPRDVDPRPNFGPNGPKLELPPLFSFGIKDGKPYVKVDEIKDVNGESPELWVRPSDISAEMQEWARKQAGGGADGGTALPRNMPPTRVPNEYAARWAVDLCLPRGGLHNPLCPVPHPPQPPPAPTGPLPDLSPLWTDRVTFQHDRPASGVADTAGLTAEGKSTLDQVIGWLRIDIKLRVRLIGHCSSEGGAEHNQQLASRRVTVIAQAIAAAGFGDRIQDPVVSDGKEAGCQSAGPGRWSCGDTKAAAEPDPADRVVEVAYFHALDLNLTLPTIGK